MFDIGFWELMLVGVVALLVLGPDRLPEAARTAGLWVSRARRAVGYLRAEIEREVDLGELKRLEREANAGLRDLVDETRAGAQTKEPSLQPASELTKKELRVTSEDELRIDGESKRSAQ
ncbi:MAG: Sec-independent protein translocase protein TatB [Gammaproteobacteria bacterium]